MARKVAPAACAPGVRARARATAPRYLEIEGGLDRGAVAALPGVESVEATGPGADGTTILRAVLSPKTEAQVPLKAAFLGGLDVRRFEVKQPSLHDAFIVMTGETWEAGR